MESPTTSPSVDWQAKYLEAWQSYRDARKKNREQSRRARQLMAAVAAKLQQKEEEMAELRALHNSELTSICQHLFNLQASLTREKVRAEAIIADREAQISQQKTEIERLTHSSKASTNSRVYSSLRNFKTSSKSDDLSSAGCSSPASSEEGVELRFPCKAPRHPPPPPPPTKLPLRMSLSVGGRPEADANNKAGNDIAASSLNPRKGILKSCSSYGSLDSQTTTSILANLQQLIEANNRVTKKLSFSRGSERLSDSGRESDETVSPPASSPPQKKDIKASTSRKQNPDSANSSFDGSSSSFEIIQHPAFGQDKTCRLSIRATKKGNTKPKPPPRSSTTKLSTTKLTSSLVNLPLGETITSGNATVINILGGEDADKKKRVKFSPEVTKDLASMEKKAIKLLEESIMNYKSRGGERSQESSCYYEPYI